MPKKIYSSFLGLGVGDKNLPDEQLYSARDIDLYRDIGYLLPGFGKTDITLDELDNDIIDIIPGMSTGGSANTYIFTDNGKVFGVLNFNDAQLDLGGGATRYITLTNAAVGKGIVAYSGTDSEWKVYYFTQGDIAMGDANSTDWSGADLDADWGSTVPTGAGALTSGARDVIEWNSYLWFTNGHYLGKLDTMSNPAVITLQAFNLGSNWAATRLFKTDNFICIFASEGSNLAGNSAPSLSTTNNKCRLYFWDGTSVSASKIIELTGITQVHAVVNKNGNIFAFVNGGTAGHYWTVLQSNGSEYYLEKIRTLQHDISGAQTNLLSPLSNGAVDLYKNNILLGTYNEALIMSIGRFNQGESFQLSCPFSASIVANSRVTAVKQSKTDKIYAGYYDGTNYKFCKFSTGYSANASAKFGYNDLGQKVRINYVKFYFKPLISGDSITCGIDIDYGTSHKLGIDSGNISYGNDGAITYKRFDKPIICHSFRPTIIWNSGGVAISKIVVDYDFVDDM